MSSLALLPPQNFAVFENAFLHEYEVSEALDMFGVNSYLPLCLLCAKSCVNEKKCNDVSRGRPIKKNKIKFALSSTVGMPVPKS